MDIQNKSESLSNKLKTRHLTMMSIAGVIGASLFVGSGDIIAKTGPAVVLVYLLGGILVILIMRMLGEMSANSPDTGSFSTYAERAIGRWAGFTIGWLYWWFWVLLMAWEAYIAGLILNEYFDFISVNIFTFIVTIALITINFLQVGKYGECEFFFALIKVMAIVTFLGCGLLAILNFWPFNGIPIQFNNFSSYENFVPNGFDPILIALLGVMFSFLGAEIVTIASSESKNPVEQTLKAMKSVVWRICLFYIGSIFIIICLVPWSDPLLSQPGYGSFRRAFEILGLKNADVIMSFVVFTSVSSAFISAHYTASRMLYSLSIRNDAPKIFSSVNSKGVPMKAVITSCIIAVGIAILNFFETLKPREILDILMNTTGIIALLVYLVIAISHLRMRQKLEKSGVDLRLKMWLFPWLTYIVILFISTSLILMLFIESYQKLVFSTLVATSIIVISGVLVQVRLKRKKTMQKNILT